MINKKQNDKNINSLNESFNFKNWLLQEMPINKFDLLGQWGKDAKKQYGFNKQDVGILENPRAVQKIHNQWLKTPFNFEFYFLRNSKAYKFREIGIVDKEWIKNNLDIEIDPNPSAITVIFTQNLGAEKYPMTGWIIAHRLAHALNRDDLFQRKFVREIMHDFRLILSDVYNINKPRRYSFSMEDENELKALANSIGKMKSATDNNLRNFFEFIMEIFAQWIVTNKIAFNPLSKCLKIGRTYKCSQLYPDEIKEYDYLLDGFAEKYEMDLTSLLNGFIGKILVM